MQAVVKSHDNPLQTAAVARSLARIPALDGVRALAILLVVAYHFRVIPAGSGALAGTVSNLEGSGWCGVDLFFVLSGFLITGILYDARGLPRYFRNFYVRRALRIFPLYYVFLAFIFLVLPAVLPPGSAWRSFDWRQHWYWSYLANADVAVHGWPMAIGHFWSLALEEQFYLVWPFVVFMLDRKRLLQLCALVVLLVPLGRLLLRDTLGPVSAYVLMPARADELALGAIVALLARSPQGLRSFVPVARAAAVVTGGVLLALFIADHGLDYIDRVIGTVGFSFFGVCFASTMVLVLAAPEWERARRLLGGRIPALIGRYSYALYVFHLPIAVFLRDQLRHAGLLAHPQLLGSVLAFQLAFTATGLAISVALAALSWRLLERRMLQLKDAFGGTPEPRVLPSSASAA